MKINNLSLLLIASQTVNAANVGNKAEISSLSDKCNITDNVPCLADDNKWYCMLKTDTTSTTITGSTVPK